MNQQCIFSRVSLNRDTHKTSLCINQLRKTLCPGAHRNLTLYFSYELPSTAFSLSQPVISSHEAQLRGVIVAVSESDSVLQGTPQLLQPLLCAGPGNELSLHFNQALGHATCNQSTNTDELPKIPPPGRTCEGHTPSQGCLSGVLPPSVMDGPVCL